MLKQYIRVHTLQKLFTLTVYLKLKRGILWQSYLQCYKLVELSKKKKRITLPFPIQALRMASLFFWRPNFVNIPMTTKGRLLE